MTSKLNTDPRGTAEGAPVKNVSALPDGFKKRALGSLAEIRRHLQTILRQRALADRVTCIQQVSVKLALLAQGAEAAGYPEMAWMALACEALLRELGEKTERLNQTSLRSVSRGLDTLGLLLDKAPRLLSQPSPGFKAVIVDDDIVAGTAITRALEKHHFSCYCLSDGPSALEYLRDHRCDIIFLDVRMPEMNGLDMCAKLRSLPMHQRTSIIFVTSWDDFETRTHSILRGGNDLMGKPFSAKELRLKALSAAFGARYADTRPRSSSKSAPETASTATSAPASGALASSAPALESAPQDGSGLPSASGQGQSTDPQSRALRRRSAYGEYLASRMVQGSGGRPQDLQGQPSAPSGSAEGSAPSHGSARSHALQEDQLRASQTGIPDSDKSTLRCALDQAYNGLSETQAQLVEERGRRKQAEQEAAAARYELEQLQRQLAALQTAAPKTPEPA